MLANAMATGSTMLMVHDKQSRPWRSERVGWEESRENRELPRNCVWGAGSRKDSPKSGTLSRPKTICPFEGRKRFRIMTVRMNWFCNGLKWLAAIALVMAVTMSSSVGWGQEEAVRTEEVVVTAARMLEPQEEATSSIIVIYEDEIKRMEANFLPEILRQVTEITLIQNGGPGKSASVQLRGASADQVVIMIDGVKVKSTTLGYYDLSGLSVDDIARIEIVKGPQSTMYGSEAIAGVINIITKKGKPGFGIGGSYERGTFNTENYSGSVSGGGRMWNFRLSGSRYKTDGISVYEDGDEEDGYENKAYSGNIGLMLAENVSVEFSRQYYEDENDLDYGSEDDDTNYTSETTHRVDTARATVFLTESWEQVLMHSKTNDFSKTEDPDASWLNSEITSEMETTDWQHNLYLGQGFTVTAGVEERKEHGENEGVFDEEIKNRAAYMNIKQKVGNVTWNLGGRYDDHEAFGEEKTYRVGVVEEMSGGGRFRASYGTGFRAPTLNQLYYDGPYSKGNPDLDPERSTSWEVGLEHDLGEQATFTITYFEQKYTDLIEWEEVAPFSWEPRNVSRAKIKGVETTLAYRGDVIDLRASHTHLETEDDNGERLRRRPKDKYFAMIGYHGASFGLSVDYTYVGMRYDNAGEQDSIDPYDVINVSAYVQLGNNIKLYGRGENIFDEDYELAAGYNTPGEAYYAGIKLEF